MSEKQTNSHLETEMKNETLDADIDLFQNEINIETDNLPENKLGNYLRSLREKSNVSLKQLSIDTKINESVLANLELENFSELPRKIYLIGFIKTFTTYFKTTPEHALKLLNDAYQLDIPKADVQGRFENHDGTDIKPSGLIKFAIISVFIVASIFVVKNLLFSKKAEVINLEITTEQIDSNTPLVGSPSNIELSQESTEDKVEPTKKNDSEAPVVVTTTKNQEENVTKDLNENEEGDQLPTEISFKKFPINYLAYLPTTEKEITEFIPENVLGPLPEEATEKIIISTNEDKTWLAYQKDDEEIKQIILKEGKILVITGNEIRIVVGNSNAIRMIHNSKEVDIKSKTGIKSLVFPTSSAAKFKLPLFYQNSSGEYVSSGPIE